MTDPLPEAGEAFSAGSLSHWEGEPVSVWASRWGIPRLEAWGRLGSTNDRARQLARSGAPAFTVVLADEQTAGRGRGGRSWSSPPGLGLWTSVLLRPRAPAAAPLLPLLVGLAVCRAVEVAMGGASAALKWPNDVLVGGRKAAGVLCEGAGEDTVIAGIGINVRQGEADFPEELRTSAVSLETAGGRAISCPQLAGTLLAELRSLVSRAVLRLDGPLAEELARRDALRGHVVAVDSGIWPGPGIGGGAGRRIRGRALGIDARGRLIVETAPGRTQEIVAGSVALVPDHATEPRARLGGDPGPAPGPEAWPHPSREP